MNLLTVDHLSVAYGKKTVIKNVSFQLDRGSLCGLLGPNAGGKTTLIRGICGLIPYDGTVHVDGVATHTLSDRVRASRISYIPQKHSIPVAVTVLNVALMGISHQLGLLDNPSTNHRERALEALTAVGLAPLAHHNFLTLSEGQKQLVILARALVQNSPLILFDEPDSALDFANKHKILSLLHALTRGDKGGLVSLHDANMALAYCDRLLLFQAGEIVADLATKTVTKEVLQRELTRIYGPVEVIVHKDNYLMVKE